MSISLLLLPRNLDTRDQMDVCRRILNIHNDDDTFIVSPISTYERVNGDETDIDCRRNGWDRCTKSMIHTKIVTRGVWHRKYISYPHNLCSITKRLQVQHLAVIILVQKALSSMSLPSFDADVRDIIFGFHMEWFIA